MVFTATERFQSTPPRRRRLAKYCDLHIKSFRISIHASAKEATTSGTTGVYYNKHFNPRLREGGDKYGSSLIICVRIISIHASAKEATGIFTKLHERLKFQSTPPRRRRQQSTENRKEAQEFQSTPPRRRRHCLREYYYSGREFQSTPPRRRRQIRNIYA